MPKRLVEIERTRDIILEAINLLADAVCTTFGPGGQNVTLPNHAQKPIITKDGVTVANAIQLKDPQLDHAIKIIKEAADRTNRLAGDGTTTSIALVREIFKQGYQSIVAGQNVTQLKYELDAGLKKVLSKLLESVIEIESNNPEKRYKFLQDIANISMNGESEIAKLVADAINITGVNGLINVTTTSKSENSIQKIEGTTIKSGWVSPFFNKDKMAKKIILNDCYILITSYSLKSAMQLKALNEAMSKLIEKGKPLLIISSACEGEFLSLMIENNQKGRLTNCVIRPPYFGVVRKEMYTDLSILTGATIIEENEGHKLEKVGIEELGRAAKVEITDVATTIIGGGGKEEELKERIEQLQDMVKDPGFNDQDKVRERLAKLDSGVVLIRLADKSEVEFEERRARIEDAINACKAALEEGIVSGGGAALLNAANVLDQSIPGERILFKACQAPIRLIAENAGKSGDISIENLSGEDNLGKTINVLTSEVVNSLESGIIDPVKVTRHGLENAVSVAGTLLTTKVMISNIPEEKPAFDPMSMMY